MTENILKKKFSGKNGGRKDGLLHDNTKLPALFRTSCYSSHFD
jgi:hypothetical protein